MTSHSEAIPLGFSDDSFPLQNFSDFANGSFSSLSNENLFTKELCLFSNNKSSPYIKLVPAFLLASRMILDRPEMYSIFLNRRPAEDEHGFCNLPANYTNDMSKEGAVSIIRKHLPFIELDGDIGYNGDEYAYTILHPDQSKDTIAIDYNIVRLISLPTSRISDSQRVSALFGIAILICHELAHVLEFRTTRDGKLKLDGKPFSTPMGATGAEAGHAWETRLFGGKLEFCCEQSGDLLTFRGLAVRSHMWDMLCRSIEPGWIKGLFTEQFWNRPQSFLICFSSGQLARHCVWNEEVWDGAGSEQDVEEGDVYTPSKKSKRPERDVVVSKLPGGRHRHHNRLCGPRRILRD